MKTVQVSKSSLLSKLTENRETHQADFEIAWDAFQEKLTKNFEARLAHAKMLKRGEHIELYVNLEMPVNHVEDYDRAIEMLGWELADEVELSESEFRQYVQDQWSWKMGFETSNTMYTGSASPSKLTIQNGR